jgi:glyoxylase-like metal-dependent hydrolase (beta-lactamase superfamily II)
VKIFPLFEGSYSVDSSKKFIPFDSAIHNAKDRLGSLFIYVQPFLVETGKDLIVFDTGLGFKNETGQLVLQENIIKAGYSPEDVSLVLMSHLHQDHAGGMVLENNGRLELTFPHAEYIVQRGEWETAFSKQSKSYRTEIFDVVQRSGSLHIVEGNGQLNSDISYELTGGHCEFHQVFLVNDNGEKCFFGGDILPEPEQLLRKFKAKYDFDGARAMELREEYGKRAAEENWTCLFYHAKSQAMGKVAYDDNGFKILPV